MATYDVTGVGGTTGHPSNGRTPYLVENTIDVSAVNGDSGAAQNDVLRVLDIPAETLVMEAGIEVLTALSSSVTLDLGITGGDVDIYVDGDTNATGYSAPTATARHVAGSADTLDVLVLPRITFDCPDTPYCFFVKSYVAIVYPISYERVLLRGI